MINLQQYINESIGLFAGCDDIVKYIEDNLNKIISDGEYTVNSKDISNLSIKFFDELYLYFKHTDLQTNGEYVIGYGDDNKQDNYEALKWNIEDKKFNFIEININYNDIDTIPEILTHELTHAWDDYILHKKNTSLRNKGLADNYTYMLNDLSHELKNDIGRATILGHTDNARELNRISNNVNTIKTIVYYINNFEVHAYIAQINGMLYNMMFTDIKEAIDYVTKKSSSFDNYKNIYNLMQTHKMADALSEISFTSNEIQRFKKKSTDIWKKVINHTYLICAEHVKK